MAPEPCATNAIEAALSFHDQWILDGFPRSERQLPSVDHEAIIYLDLTKRLAIQRLSKRGRATIDIEWHRIEEQSKLLVPVRQVAAVILPVAHRTPEEVLSMVVDWYEHDIHPAGKGMGA